MSTPESKLQLRLTNSASKYLTPCRTLGLKRKSSSPRTPCSKLVCRVENKDSPVSSLGNVSKLPLQNIENKIPDICVQSQKEVPKLNVSAQKSNFKTVCDNLMSKSNEPPPREKENSISNEKLLETINNVNSKIEKINNLKRNEAYTKKHNIIELKESTEKWKNACKDVVLTIYETMKSKGHDLSIKNILDEHNIPYEQIGFNEDTMDFD
ncbi:uncharacterized protein [Halyomorpha halys]|uniref:uncharacterized protein n=1 Tax=Halyomorpha halys TaxID=286706 RepID=UPI0006D5209F|nr:uncharacterized protein LOC106677485 [Halyomorpha halys]XP_014270944.1 uncharacterized protein LOC106677485 [Halyomorpha halys]XP_014270945.1 uncharacterized protein LOC106677485 [Halyomorpha halys]